MLQYIKRVLETQTNRKLEVLSTEMLDGSLALIATMTNTKTNTELFRAQGFGNLENTLLALDIMCAQLVYGEKTP